MNSKVRFYADLHRHNIEYGTGATFLEKEISVLIEMLQPKIVLDYGCGKGRLVRLLKNKYPQIAVFGYDPAIPEMSELPVDKADLIINTDVLEHIPEDELPDTIKKIRSISSNVFFNLHHGKATQILENGENAHCTVKDKVWYHDLFKKYFDVVIPLPGADSVSSAVVTFPLTDVARSSYLCVVQDKREKMAIENIKREREKERRHVYSYVKNLFSFSAQKSYNYHNDMSVFMLKKMLTIYKTVGVFTDLMTSVAMLVAALISSINCYILLTGEGINRPFWRELFWVAWGIFAIIVYLKGKNTMDLEVAEWLIDEKKDIQD